MEQEVREADHGSHHVVHLVRHPSRQLAGGLHPLRPPEAFLHAAALGHVGGAEADPQHGPLIVHDRLNVALFVRVETV